MGIAERIHTFRHSTLFLGLTFFIPLFLMVWEQAFIFTYAVNFITSQSTLATWSNYWWTSNGSGVSATIVCPLFGLWLNLYSTSSLMIFAHIFAVASTTILVLIPPSPSVMIVSQLGYGIWWGAVLVSSLSYFARAIAQARRTPWVLAVYFMVNSFGPVVLTPLVSVVPLVVAGWLLNAMLLACLSFFVFFPEQPVSHMLDDYRVPFETRFSTFKRAFRNFFTGQSVVAILCTVFMVLCTELGFQVYNTLLGQSLVAFQLSPSATNGFLYGGLAGVTLCCVAVLVSLRCLPEKLVLVLFSAALTIGYLLVIQWNPEQPPAAWRYLFGAALITVSAQVIMGIGNSVLTKITSHALQGVWMGMIVSLQWLVALLSAVWLPGPTQSTSALPYEITLGLIGLSLLLMIPVYRLLLPQMFSPWSGPTLPSTNSHVSMATVETESLLRIGGAGGGSGGIPFSPYGAVARSTMSPSATRLTTGDGGSMDGLD